MFMSPILDEMKDISDEFLYQIKRYEDYYGAWQELNSAIVQFNKQIYIANDFFSVAYEALLNSMMMELMKLYDQHRDSLSIKKLLRKCQTVKEFAFVFHDIPEKNAIYKNVLVSFGSFLEKETTKSSLENLITRRDRYYMHNDGKKIKIQTLVDKNSFSFDDAEELISEAKKFCTAIYRLATDKEWEPWLHQGTRLEHIRDFSGLKLLLSFVRDEAFNK